MRLKILFGLVLAVIATPAAAHTGHSGNASFMAGLLHPLTGWDHLLAIAAIGLWSVVRSGRASMVWPTVFLASVLTGFGVASFGAVFPALEHLMLASILIPALLAVSALRVGLWSAATAICFFGFAHGHLHGLEVGANALLPFAAGMCAAMAGLLLVIVLGGRATTAAGARNALRWTAGVLATTGAALGLVA
jgi:urease accessory protein